MQGGEDRRLLGHCCPPPGVPAKGQSCSGVGCRHLQQPLQGQRRRLEVVQHLQHGAAYRGEAQGASIVCMPASRPCMPGRLPLLAPNPKSRPPLPTAPPYQAQPPPCPHPPAGCRHTGRPAPLAKKNNPAAPPPARRWQTGAAPEAHQRAGTGQRAAVSRWRGAQRASLGAEFWFNPHCTAAQGPTKGGPPGRRTGAARRR